MRHLKKSIALLVAFAMAALLLTGLAPVVAVAGEGYEGFAIESIAVVDTRTAIVTFNAPMNDALWTYMNQAPLYWGKWMKISGGTAGAADAALDGRPLSESRARTYPRDDKKSFELVLGGDARFMAGSAYAFAFITTPWVAEASGQTQTSKSFLHDVDGRTVADNNTFAFTADAAVVEPVPTALTAVEFKNLGRVDLAFNKRVTGMPSRIGFTAGQVQATERISVSADGVTTKAYYVESLPGSNGKMYSVYFGAPLAVNTNYTLQIEAALNLKDIHDANVGLVTSALRTAEAVSDFKLVSARRERISTGNELVLTFDNVIARTKLADGSKQTLYETTNGRTGATLTREDIMGMFETEVHASLAPQAGEWQFSDLPDICGYFRDSKTIVIHDSPQKRLQAATHIKLKAGVLQSFDGSWNTEGAFAVIASGDQTSPVTGYDPDAADYLTLTRSTVTFRHHDYNYDQYDGTKNPLVEGIDPRLKIFSWESYRRPDVAEQVFDVWVVENKFIKATFLPEFSGRLLSMIYKPTGNDLLYLNDVGTPYGTGFGEGVDPLSRNGTSPFYSNWLMVWGGIFPTFPMPEHGKFWYLPWDYTIEGQTGSDEIRIKMHQVDDIDYKYTQQPRFNAGHTDLEAFVDFVVTKTAPAVKMDVKVFNPGAEGKTYEFWTCTTLAPGADTYDGSPTGKIVDSAQVIFRDGYPWMGDVEGGTAGQAYASLDDAPEYVRDFARNTNSANTANNRRSQYLNLNNLNYFARWLGTTGSGGIGYAQDLARLPQADWWGVINEENQEGVLRIADNTITPGMKYWLWGYDISFSTKQYSSGGSSARPYIELWGGPSNKFFDPAFIKAGETISWNEAYIPTAGLSDVTNANENGAASIHFDRVGDGFQVKAEVFSTLIGKTLTAELVTGDNQVIASGEFVAHAVDSETIAAALPVPAGTKVTLKLYQGEHELLTAWAVQGSKPEPDVIAVEEVSLSAKDIELDVDGPGKNLISIIRPFPADNKKMLWTSSDPAVASVPTVAANNMLYPYTINATQAVTPRAVGDAVVTVKTEDGGFEATCNVKVFGPVTGVKLAGASTKSIRKGKVLDIGSMVTVEPAGHVRNADVVYRVSNAAVAQITADGILIGVKPGMVLVTVTTAEGAFVAQNLVTVTM